MRLFRGRNQGLVEREFGWMKEWRNSVNMWNIAWDFHKLEWNDGCTAIFIHRRDSAAYWMISRCLVAKERKGKEKKKWSNEIWNIEGKQDICLTVFVRNATTTLKKLCSNLGREISREKSVNSMILANCSYNLVLSLDPSGGSGLSMIFREILSFEVDELSQADSSERTQHQKTGWRNKDSKENLRN
jgi:hypothetical protein